jgi:hypothetical protein
MSDLTRDRDAELAMDAATFRTLGRQLVDQLATMLEAAPQGPVTRDRTPTGVRQAFGLAGFCPRAAKTRDRCSSARHACSSNSPCSMRTPASLATLRPHLRRSASLVTSWRQR